MNENLSKLKYLGNRTIYTACMKCLYIILIEYKLGINAYKVGRDFGLRILL